jgi:hypothetical protein
VRLAVKLYTLGLAFAAMSAGGREVGAQVPDRAAARAPIRVVPETELAADTAGAGEEGALYDAVYGRIYGSRTDTVGRRSGLSGIMRGLEGRRAARESAPTERLPEGLYRRQGVVSEQQQAIASTVRQAIVREFRTGNVALAAEAIALSERLVEAASERLAGSMLPDTAGAIEAARTLAREVVRLSRDTTATARTTGGASAGEPPVRPGVPGDTTRDGSEVSRPPASHEDTTPGATGGEQRRLRAAPAAPSGQSVPRQLAASPPSRVDRSLFERAMARICGTVRSYPLC